MPEKAYTCVLCSHDFTSAEPPKRCPACLSSRGVQEVGPAGTGHGKAGGAGQKGKSGRGGLIAALVAIVLVGGAIGAYFLVTTADTEVDEPADTPAAAEPGAAGGREVNLEVAPDPTAATPTVEQYAKEHLKPEADTAKAKTAALQGHLKSLVAARRLKQHDVEEGLERRPLTADGVVAALAGDEPPPPLLPLEAASFVAALARATGLDVDIVEQTDAPNSATSLPRMRLFARVNGTAIDPWADDQTADVPQAKLQPLSPDLVRALYQGTEALAEAEAGKFKKANEEVGVALRLAPDESALTFLKGQVAVLSGMVQFGIEDLERALAQEEDALGRFNLGVAYVQAQRFFKAHEALRRAIELDPKFAPAWLALAQLHVARIQLSPESEREGLIRSANEAIEKAREIDPDAEGIAVTTAQVLLANEDERGAITLLDDAIRVHPERPQPYVLLGSLLANKGKWAELIAYLKPGMKHNPGNEQIRRLLLLAYMSQDRVEDAEKLLTDALAAAPDTPGLRVELAGLLAQSGRKDDAHRLLEEELARNPESNDASLLLAQLDLDDGKPKRAAARLDQVIESQPANFEALALRYMAAAQMGDEKAQKKLLDRVATARPNGRAILAQLLLEQGLVEQGAAVLEAVLRDRPGSPGESIMLYATYTSLGREEDAKRIRETALAAVDEGQKEQLEAQFDQVQSEARRVHAAAAAAGAAQDEAATVENEGAEGAAAAEEGAAGEGAKGEGVPSPGLDTGLGGGGGMPSIDLNLKLPDAPGEKRDEDLPGGGPKIDLPEMPGMP